jgi:hypothetical protein
MSNHLELLDHNTLKQANICFWQHHNQKDLKETMDSYNNGNAFYVDEDYEAAEQVTLSGRQE